ncbi:hypothetical protein ABK040_001692 [Willaertia magna]
MFKIEQQCEENSVIFFFSDCNALSSFEEVESKTLRLCNDEMLLIFKFLSPFDLLKIKFVCRDWYKLIENYCVKIIKFKIREKGESFVNYCKDTLCKISGDLGNEIYEFITKDLLLKDKGDHYEMFLVFILFYNILLLATVPVTVVTGYKYFFLEVTEVVQPSIIQILFKTLGYILCFYFGLPTVYLISGLVYLRKYGTFGKIIALILIAIYQAVMEFSTFRLVKHVCNFAQVIGRVIVRICKWLMKLLISLKEISFISIMEKLKELFVELKEFIKNAFSNVKDLFTEKEEEKLFELDKSVWVMLDKVDDETITLQNTYFNTNDKYILNHSSIKKEIIENYLNDE